MKRTCKKCGDEKELELFEKRKGCKLGYGYNCRACINKMTRFRYSKMPEELKVKEINRCKKYKKNNIEKVRKQKKIYEAANIDKRTKRQLKASSSLLPCYIKKLLSQKTNIKRKDIPPSLINLVRETIKTKRLLKELTS